MAAKTDIERIDRLEKIVAVLVDQLFPHKALKPRMDVPYELLDELEAEVAASARSAV